MAFARTALAAALTGTLATVTVTAALRLLSKRDGKSALQPIDATSHWLEDPRDRPAARG